MKSPSPFLLLTLLACKQESAADNASPTDPTADFDTGDGDGDDNGDEGDGDGDPDLSPAEDLPQGTFLLTFLLAPVGGLPVPFQAEAVGEVDPEGQRYLSLSLKATDSAGESLSDVLLDMDLVEVAEDGSFSADPPSFTLPGDFSPTGSDVEVDVALSGMVGATSLCGDLSGEIVTFGMDLEGSTFGTIRWEDRADGFRGSCEDSGGGIDPIETCPSLVAGLNEDFPSGGQMRSFELVLPSTYTPEEPWPVVFAFHGLGGNIASILDSTGLRPMADERGVIVVVPQGEDYGGSPGWDAINPEGRNYDLAYFDDLMLCLGQQYSVDAERIHVTGISNGGLFTGLLAARRSDVIAAAAPFSGGIITDDYEGPRPLPLLVSWGGEEDFAYEQDFHQLAQEMITTARGWGSFVVACDHEMGHTLESEFWPWAMDFLLAHPRDVAGSPYSGGLPESFPEYCSIVE